MAAAEREARKMLLVAATKELGERKTGWYGGASKEVLQLLVLGCRKLEAIATHSTVPVA